LVTAERASGQAAMAVHGVAEGMEALGLSEQQKFYERALSLHREGVALLQDKKCDAALKKFARARAASLRLHDRDRALRIEHTVTSSMSTARRLQKDYEGAIRLGERAVALATKLGHEEDLVEEQRMLDIARAGFCHTWLLRAITSLDASRAGDSAGPLKLSAAEQNEHNVAALVFLAETVKECAFICDNMIRDKTDIYVLNHRGVANLFMKPQSLKLETALGDFRQCALLARKWKDKETLRKLAHNNQHALLIAPERLQPLCREVLSIVDLSVPLPASIEADEATIALLNRNAQTRPPALRGPMLKVHNNVPT